MHQSSVVNKQGGMVTKILLSIFIFLWGVVFGLVLPPIIKSNYFKSTFLKQNIIQPIPNSKPTVIADPSPEPEKVVTIASSSNDFLQYITSTCNPQNRKNVRNGVLRNLSGIIIRQRRADLNLKLNQVRCELLSDRVGFKVIFFNKPSKKIKDSAWVSIDSSPYLQANSKSQNLSAVPDVYVYAYVETTCKSEIGCQVGKDAAVSMIGEKWQTFKTGEKIRIWTRINNVVKASDKRLIEFIEKHATLTKGAKNTRFVSQQLNNTLLIDAFSTALTAPIDGGMSYVDFVTDLLRSVSFDEEVLTP